jgi:hypothetical protein
MESTKFSIILLFTLLFYLILLIVLNRLIIYKSFKTYKIDDKKIYEKLPLILAGNLSVFISLFILIKPLINFITYQTNNSESLFFMFSVCSIIFILNIIILIISYSLSIIISTFLIKLNNTILQGVLWLVICTILITITNEYYNLITSSNAFNIY